MLINAIFGLDLEIYGRDRLPRFNGHYVNFLILVLPVATSKEQCDRSLGIYHLGDLVTNSRASRTAEDVSNSGNKYPSGMAGP